MTRLAAVILLAAVLVAGCGAAKEPKDAPGLFATKVVDLIVYNKYSDAWGALHPVDQEVAPSTEYVGCENRNLVIAVPRTVKVLSVKDESIGIGDGTFVDSKAVAVRLGFAGNFKVTHTVHVVADHGKWTGSFRRGATATTRATGAQRTRAPRHRRPRAEPDSVSAEPDSRYSNRS